MKAPTRDEWAFILGAAQVVVHGLAVFYVYRIVQFRLGPEQFGIWALGFSALSFISVAQLGVASALLRHIPVLRVKTERGDGDGITVKDLYWTSITLVTAGGAAVITLFVAPFYFFITVGLSPEDIADLNRIYGILIAYGLATVVGQIPYNALIALGRPIVAYLVFMIGSVLLVAVSYLWIDVYGLVAVSLAFLIYRAASLAICHGIMVRMLAGESKRSPWFSRTAFRRIFPTSFGLLISDIPVMFCDPVAKVLLNNFGGLSIVGYYEMARRLAGQLREVAIRPARMLIPRLAESIEKDDFETERAIFARMQRSLNSLAVAFFAVLAAGAPLISIIWLGYDEPLLTINIVLAAGSVAIGFLAVGSYFSFIAQGRPWVIVAAHGLTLALLGVFGAIGGYFGGPIACLVLLTFGYSVGSCYLIYRMFPERFGWSVFTNAGAVGAALMRSVPAMACAYAVDQLLLAEAGVLVRVAAFTAFAAVAGILNLRALRIG